MLNQRSRIALDTLLPREANTTLKYGVFDTDFDAFWADVERTGRYLHGGGVSAWPYFLLPGSRRFSFDNCHHYLITTG